MSTGKQAPRLVVQQAGGEELVYTLDQGRTLTIGRDDDNAIVLKSPFVSKRHAIVSWTVRGVRIEDQDSANGIAVNGLTVHAAQLSGGDVVRIGDQTLTFEAAGASATADAAAASRVARPPNKMLRLLLVAVLTFTLLGGMLAAAYLLLLAPGASGAEGQAATTEGRRVLVSMPADTPITPFDSPEALEIEKMALTANGAPVDWIYDEGSLAFRNGRLLDAYRLFHGVLLRDPQHQGARRELLRVMGERDVRLKSFQAAATRAETELKFEEAARQWEQVMAMTLDTEDLHIRAKQESARLRERANVR